MKIIYVSETGTTTSVSSEIRSLLSTHLPCTLRCVSAVGIDELRSIASATDKVSFLNNIALLTNVRYTRLNGIYYGKWPLLYGCSEILYMRSEKIDQ